MKKIINFMICSLVTLTMLYVPVKAAIAVGPGIQEGDGEPVPTTEQVVTNLSWENFTGEINAGEKFKTTFDVKEGYSVKEIRFRFNDYYDFRTNELNSFYVEIEERHKYSIESLDFLYCEISLSDSNGVAMIEYQAFDIESAKPYIADNTGIEVDNINFNIFACNDFSFVIKDADIDITAPTFKLLTLEQNGSIVTTTFESVETQSGIMNVAFNFTSTENETMFISYGFDVLEEIDENTYKASTDLMSTLQYTQNSYGIYTLNSVTVMDKVMKRNTVSEETFENYTVSLDKKDNVLESIKAENLIVETNYLDNHLYFRVSEDGSLGVGSDTINLYYMNKDEKTLLTTFTTGNNTMSALLVSATRSTIDCSEAKDSEQTINLVLRKNKTENNEITIKVPVHVVEPIGKVIESTLVLEECMTYEEYKALEAVYGMALPKITVQLDDGTIIREEVKGSGIITDDGFEDDGSYLGAMGTYAYYNPKYICEEAESENTVIPGLGTTGGISGLQGNKAGAVKIVTIYHISDEEGNLVDKDGNVIVDFEDRDEIDFVTDDTNVEISGLEGTVPSYTIVKVKKVKEHKDFKDKDFVAYEIKLNANHDTVQPVGYVDLVILMPKDYKNNESFKAYHYDDEGNKEEVEVYIHGGKAYIKATSFSTYVIVREETSTESGNNSTENNTNTGNSNSNNTESNTNTTTPPTTGDSTNVVALFTMLIASAYVLTRKRA